MKDYYDILGVPTDIDKEELKRAYRILVHQYHPDKENGNEDKFKAVNEAYRVLSGNDSRAKYDAEYRSYKKQKFDAGAAQEKTSAPPASAPTSDVNTKNYNPLVIFLIIIIVLLVVTLISKSPDDDRTPRTEPSPFISPTTQLPGATEKTVVSTTDFPVEDRESQYRWYLDNDIPRNAHCFTYSSCTEEEWAYAVYGDRMHPGGKNLKTRADTLKAEYKSQFPTKCVEESGVRICDLSYSVLKTYDDGQRSIKLEGNAIYCVNAVTGALEQTPGNSSQISPASMYCVSDFGAVYIDPTIEVTKHFGEIYDLRYGSNFSIKNDYRACIWTYVDGAARIPYMLVSASLGPTSGYTVRAFCTNFDNRVYIYSS